MKIRRVFMLALIAVTAWCANAPALGPFTFVQLCDPQLGKAGYEHDKTMLRLAVRYINHLNPAFVVCCGDLIDSAKYAQAYEDFNEIVAGLRMPAHYAIGNNDQADLFALYIGADYHSFTHEGYTFIVVNTMLWVNYVPGTTETMDAWLLSELQAASQQGSPVFVAGHHPLPLKSGEPGDDSPRIPREKSTDVLALFEQYGVVAYLAGHLHMNFESDYNGIQLVTSGATCYTIGDQPGFRLWRVEGERPFAHEFLHVADVYNGRDTDRDGLPDAVEDANFNGLRDADETDPYNADTDGDGISDGQERAFGLDPLTPDFGVSIPAMDYAGMALLCALIMACAFSKRLNGLSSGAILLSLNNRRDATRVCVFRRSGD
ncbi:MAG TPA: metallophosphoesterase [Candidatus Hydrogenedentes bacterium]|nr:metallophosphoesterase [Candidatus Hydrogenedentota bacterium]HOT51071.1 metallophosphoesterase [Candidatus Hydrogenedentota bacterium]HPC15405.1 metallophosphoesterase [Candidatus Hydrogenedentota bacterium]HRT21156.1 metallophosphoesterase [Candidatus Hydrogenedentota bacterium]HRT64381.1 metallophosphoesterase [Candidatus Hydrogenedentota bacterium]